MFEHTTCKNEQYDPETNYALPPEYTFFENRWWSAIEDELVELVNEARRGDGSELEVRFGKLGTRDAFVTGVKVNTFRYLLAKMEAVNTWTNEPKWTRISEYIFNKNSRVKDTSSQVHARTVDSGNTTFIKKTLIKGKNVRVNGSCVDVRVAVSTEDHTSISREVPSWVRFKERKSFVYQKKYSYDMTKVWEGKDKKSASESSPKYEIEIEYIWSDTVHNEKTEDIVKGVMGKSTDIIQMIKNTDKPVVERRKLTSPPTTPKAQTKRQSSHAPNWCSNSRPNNGSSKWKCDDEYRKRSRYTVLSEANQNVYNIHPQAGAAHLKVTERQYSVEPHQEQFVLSSEFLQGIDRLHAQHFKQ